MEINDDFVFQVDSSIVSNYYDNSNNYLIEYSKHVSKKYCVIYLSSNDLYYPNNDIAFNESIVKKDRYEWYANRINKGYKHIFLRDIRKQWYLTGINKEISTLQKLIDFLRVETLGYEVLLVGSSAGGFCSVIIGQSLKAEKIYSFNGQFELLSLLNKSKKSIDPILFRNSKNEELLRYYDSLNFITNPSTIFYFHSNKSQWDKEQLLYVKDLNINVISFKTSNHGLPFLKTNLPVVLNLTDRMLISLAGNIYSPLLFSLKMVGLKKTISGFKAVFKFGINKIYIYTLQKWKRKNT